MPRKCPGDDFGRSAGDILDVQFCRSTPSWAAGHLRGTNGTFSQGQTGHIYGTVTPSMGRSHPKRGGVVPPKFFLFILFFLCLFPDSQESFGPRLARNPTKSTKEKIPGVSWPRG